MNLMSRLIIGAGVAGSLLTGGVIGATIAGPLGASAATSSSAATTRRVPRRSLRHLRVERDCRARGR